jgi:hypothetical protein
MRLLWGSGVGRIGSGFPLGTSPGPLFGGEAAYGKGPGFASGGLTASGQGRSTRSWGRTPYVVSHASHRSIPRLASGCCGNPGQYPTLFAQAGLALEEALEQDPVPAVQEAARQALWNYHLLGYRSSKGVEGFVGQTQEPPLAPQAVRSYSQVISSYSSETPAPLPAVRRVPSLWSSSCRRCLRLPPLSRFFSFLCLLYHPGSFLLRWCCCDCRTAFSTHTTSPDQHR